MKNYTGVKDIENLNELVDLALSYKVNPFVDQSVGKNKVLGLLFFNPSLRTRLSTQIAAKNLGLDVISINIDKDSWNLELQDGAIMNLDKAEHIKDAAQVISQYCDIIAIRTFPGLKDRDQDYSEPVINAFLKHASVPIVSLESATGHPLQALADLMTIRELSQKSKKKVVLTWAPHPRALPQAVPNSFVEFMSKADDVELVICHPPGYELNPMITKDVQIVHNQDEAFVNADFIYAKNWSSYEQYGQILSQDSSWMVDQTKMDMSDDGKFMHCLPVRRNVIVSDQVMDSKSNISIVQAKNRTFSAQAVLKQIIDEL